MLSIECHCPSSQKYKRFVYAQGVSLIFTANPSARYNLVATVADAGFPSRGRGWGAVPKGGGVNLLFWSVFHKNCMKMKNWTGAVSS